MGSVVRSTPGRVAIALLAVLVLAVAGLSRRGTSAPEPGAPAGTSGGVVLNLGTPAPLPLGAGLGEPPDQFTAAPQAPPAGAPPAPRAVDGPAGAVAGTPIVNATHGQIDDSAARQMGTAYLASVRWTVRAVEDEDTTILDILFPAGNRDTSTETLIVNVRSANATVTYPPGHAPRVTRLVLIALSAAQQQQIQTDAGVVAGPYAGIVTYQGPIDVTVTWPGAPPRSYSVLREGREISEVSVGGVVDDPRLGSVWRETYSRDCAAHPDPSLCP